jgi:hypothetical protein
MNQTPVPGIISVLALVFLFNTFFFGNYSVAWENADNYLIMLVFLVRSEVRKRF